MGIFYDNNYFLNRFGDDRQIEIELGEDSSQFKSALKYILEESIIKHFDKTIETTEDIYLKLVKDFLSKGADNATYIEYFKDPNRTILFFNEFKDQCNTVIGFLGYYLLTSDVRWDTTDPLALKENNQKIVVYKSVEYGIATIWHDYTGKYITEGLGYFLPKRYPIKTEYPKDDEEIPFDHLAEESIYITNAKYKYKTNFVLVLYGSIIPKFNVYEETLFQGYKEVTKNRHYLTTEPMDKGGNFCIQILYKKLGTYAQDYYSIICEHGVDDSTLVFKVLDKSGNILYTNTWTA